MVKPKSHALHLIFTWNEVYIPVVVLTGNVVGNLVEVLVVVVDVEVVVDSVGGIGVWGAGLWMTCPTSVKLMKVILSFSSSKVVVVVIDVVVGVVEVVEDVFNGCTGRTTCLWMTLLDKVKLTKVVLSFVWNAFCCTEFRGCSCIESITSCRNEFFRPPSFPNDRKKYIIFYLLKVFIRIHVI